MATYQEEEKAKSRTKEIDTTEALITLREACQMLHVHANTLRRWCDSGLVRPCRLGPRGDRRFRPQDLIALLNERHK